MQATTATADLTSSPSPSGAHLDVRVPRRAAAELTSKRRNALDDSDFAVPAKRKLPINDARHVRNALSRFDQTEGLTAEEKATAKSRIRAAAKKFGIKVGADFAEFRIFAQPLLVTCGELDVDAAAFKEGQPLPFVRVGEHEFSDSYGLVTITPDDLDSIVRGFEVGARRQDLPLVNEEHIPAAYSDDGEVLMGPGAVGWISKMWREGDTVWFTPDWNAAGERLLADDRYRAVSPELFLNWTDPETGESWGMTAAGVALTTRPRMKNLAHVGSPLQAGERGARVLAFAERDMAYAADVHVDEPLGDMSVAYGYPSRKRLPLHTAEAVKGSRARFLTIEATEDERDEAWGRIRAAAETHGLSVPPDWRELRASEAASVLMQEAMVDDVDQDLAAGMAPPCSYQPPYGCCPGYTRSDPDNDGDADVCLMADRGCNGYIPLQMRASFVSPQAPAYYGEGRPGGTMNTTTTPVTTTATTTEPVVVSAPAAATTTVPAPVTPAVPEVKPAAPVRSAEPVSAPAEPTPADFAELKNLVLAERRARLEAESAAVTRIAAAEERATAAEQRVRDQEAAVRLAEVARELEELVKTGRITPAERDVYAGDNLAKFAEHGWLLDGLKQRPASSAIDMKERGSGQPDDSSESTSQRMDRMAKARMAEKGQSLNMRSKEFLPQYLEALAEVNKAGYRSGS